jgi:hypothetical protein
LAVPLSATKGSNRASSTVLLMLAIALLTTASVRPFTITVAPSLARDRAISMPIPPDEAVTKANLPFSPRSMFASPFMFFSNTLMRPSFCNGIHFHIFSMKGNSLAFS